jgi:hypothetical protein
VNIALGSERDDTWLVSHQNRPVLVSFEQGEGRVILGTIANSFTNAGLKQAGNPELVLNILALAREKGAVWFDEWHHGVQSGEQILGPTEFLRETPFARCYSSRPQSLSLIMRTRLWQTHPSPAGDQTPRRTRTCNRNRQPQPPRRTSLGSDDAIS